MMSLRARPGGTRGLAGLLLGVLLAGGPAISHPASATPLNGSHCDFNGDGRDDLVIGVPAKGLNGVPDMGAVIVLYGSQSGLTGAGSQLWHQGVAGILDIGEPGDHFGSSVSCGDFDNEGTDDLAVGVPGEDLPGLPDAGLVNVIYGSRSGLRSSFNQLWSQESGAIGGVAERRDGFGSAVAAGDFDGNGADDLAIGSPFERVGDGTTDASEGAVNVIYGASGVGGLTSAGNQLLTQDTAGVHGDAERKDLFGSALSAGEFDGNRGDDLAVGVPGEDIDTLTDAGAVNVLYGSPAGLSTSNNDLFHQGDSGMRGVAEARDHLGYALASGDFDGNGRDDLAIGAPGEDILWAESAGAVNVLYGTAGGLSTAEDDLWSESSALDVEPHDRFGSSLAAGDYTGNGRDDLAIGAPWDGISDRPEAGLIHLMYGTMSGLDTTNLQVWHQDQPTVDGASQAFDHFGETLISGDFDGNGRVDLGIGVPGEDVATLLPGGPIRINAGAVNVLYGRAGPMDARNNRRWHQDSAGVAGSSDSFDRMAGLPRSHGSYRIGFADGTKVSLSGDRMTHTPPDRIDMSGEDSDTIVAARSGTIQAVVDTNAEPTNNNNYVWISHTNGEWTKYTHFVQNSVRVRRGQTVSAGTALGTEGDVGQADGVHLHFEVGVPDNPNNAIDPNGYLIGFNLDPVVCNIPGQTFIAGQRYTAADC